MTMPFSEPFLSLCRVNAGYRAFHAVNTDACMLQLQCASRSLNHAHYKFPTLAVSHCKHCSILSHWLDLGLLIIGNALMYLWHKAQLKKYNWQPMGIVMSCRVALAWCVVGMAKRLNEHRQWLGCQMPALPARSLRDLDKLLQRCYKLYTEHLMESDPPLTAKIISEILPKPQLVSTVCSCLGSVDKHNLLGVACLNDEKRSRFLRQCGAHLKLSWHLELGYGL